MWLLVDDVRDLPVDAIARNASAAKQLLSLRVWTTLCLDHDLGGEESGYDVLMWAIKNSCVPPHVQIVSSNPVGVSRIAQALIHDLNYWAEDMRNLFSPDVPQTTQGV